MKLALNLDHDFRPSFAADGGAKDLPYERLQFNGGEQHVRINSTLSKGDEVWITHRLTNSNRIMQVLLAADAVRGLGVVPSLFIGYMPYGRQDRRANPGEPHSLRVFCGLLEAAQFDRIAVYDPHSDVIEALVENIRVVDNAGFISWVKIDSPPLLLVAPDAGAAKKIYKLADRLGHDGGIAVGMKHRDTMTGQLRYHGLGGDDVAGADCLIVDDICDRGGTFIALAALRDQSSLHHQLLP
jgi:ribose-phosphate pyrophosphokinase